MSISVDADERNLLIKKFICESTTATSQNDLWHAMKAIKKALYKIGNGPQYQHGRTWHEQLKDTGQSKMLLQMQRN